MQDTESGSLRSVAILQAPFSELGLSDWPTYEAQERHYPPPDPVLQGQYYYQHEEEYLHYDD